MKKVLTLVSTVLVAAPLVLAATAFAQAPAAAPAAPAAGAPAAPAPPPPPPQVQAPKTQEAKPSSVGQDYAAFQLPLAFENKMAKFSDLMGTQGKAAKITVLTFTNTSCASCMDEMMVLSSLKSKYGKDIFVVAVVTDYNAKRIAENLGEDTKKAYTFVSDPYFTVPPLYGFTSTPATAFIKPNGKVDLLDSGYLPTDAGRKAYIEKVEKYLK